MIDYQGVEGDSDAILRELQNQNKVDQHEFFILISYFFETSKISSKLSLLCSYWRQGDSPKLNTVLQLIQGNPSQVALSLQEGVKLTVKPVSSE